MKLEVRCVAPEWVRPRLADGLSEAWRHDAAVGDRTKRLLCRGASTTGWVQFVTCRAEVTCRWLGSVGLWLLLDCSCIVLRCGLWGLWVGASTAGRVRFVVCPAVTTRGCSGSVGGGRVAWQTVGGGAGGSPVRGSTEQPSPVAAMRVRLRLTWGVLTISILCRIGVVGGGVGDPPVRGVAGCPPPVAVLACVLLVRSAVGSAWMLVGDTVGDTPVRGIAIRMSPVMVKLCTLVVLSRSVLCLVEGAGGATPVRGDAVRAPSVDTVCFLPVCLARAMLSGLGIYCARSLVVAGMFDHCSSAVGASLFHYR